jgi:peptide/nickel transport system permease protein
VSEPVGPGAGAGQAEEHLRHWLRAAFRDSLRHGRTWVGLVLTAGVVLLALIGPLVAPHTPTEFVGAPFSGPAAGMALGTDYLGEDVLSRVLHGGRSVLWMATMAGLTGTVAGTLLGVVAGYAGRRTDNLVMRALDVFLALPQIVFVLLFVSMLGVYPWLIVALVGISWAPSVARTVRAATLGIVNQEFVEAAEAVGVPRGYILGQEILPNIMGTVLVELGLRIAWSTAAISAISFLGYGISPPAPDWGLMISENNLGLTAQPRCSRSARVCSRRASVTPCPARTAGRGRDGARRLRSNDRALRPGNRDRARRLVRGARGRDPWRGG